MPTTDPFDLPYPDDEDWLNQGAYAIEQLAEALVERLTPSHVRTNPGSDQTLTGSYAYVEPGSIATAWPPSDWSLSGGALTYSGKTRWHLLDFEAEVIAAPSGGGTASWVVVLQVGGVEVGRADAEISDASASTRARITVPAYLTPGVVVTAAALASSGAGSIGQARLVSTSISAKETA